MKILQIYNHFNPCIGGIERHVEDLCINLIKRGHKCDVLCLNACARSGRRLPSFETYRGIGIYRLPYLDLKLYKIAPSILRYIRGYDLLHVHGLGFFADLLALTKLLHGKPLVLSTHGGIFHTASYKALKEFYFNVWCRGILRIFNAVVTVSKSDEKLFSRICEKTMLVPNAIDARSFRSCGGRDFVYVGRLSKNKRVERLIKVFSLLKERIYDAKLLIVGEDWGIKRELRALVKSLGIGEHAVFKEGVDREELIGLLQRAGFFLSASEYEGFGISVLEAMASGLVVFVSDIPAFRELVEDGVNGFIVDYSRPEEASEKIAKTIKGDLSAVRRKARETALEYDLARVAEKIEYIYEGLKGAAKLSGESK